VTQVTELDGVSYTLTFWQNTRSERLYMDLSDASGNPLAMGITLVFNVDLLREHRYRTDLPPGPLVAMPIGPNHAAAMTYADFNARAALVYNDASDE
jgi:hypothetical protein